jgi:hypothetical protein
VRPSALGHALSVAFAFAMLAGTTAGLFRGVTT